MRRFQRFTLAALACMAVACTSRTDADQQEFLARVSDDVLAAPSDQLDLLVHRAPGLTANWLSPETRVVTPDGMVKAGRDSVIALYVAILSHTPLVRIDRQQDSITVDTTRRTVRRFGTYTLWLRRPKAVDPTVAERGCFVADWVWSERHWTRTLDSLAFCAAVSGDKALPRRR